MVTTGRRALALEVLLVRAGHRVAHSCRSAPRAEDFSPEDFQRVDATYRALGGTATDARFRPGPWDLAFDGGLVVELDEELHFNRYRRSTLEQPWTSPMPWRDDYLTFSLECESACLAAGRWGKRWTNTSCERLFGAADPPGTFVPVGAPRWKQRALYDAMKDIWALGGRHVQLARLAMTAEELMRRLETDLEFQEAKLKRDEEFNERAAVLREAERPIVDDIRRAGYDVSSVWDLVNTSEPYPDALPILLDHLTRGGYPDRVMESMGRAIAVGPAIFAWDILRDLYLRAGGRGEEEGLAVALAASATPAQLEPLIGLIGEDSRGDSRIHFLRAIKRVGGQRGAAVLNALIHDSLFGREASALVG